MVHFGVETDGEVRPLCGDWGGVPNWTKVPGAVSCPRCLTRIVHEHEREPDDREPPPPPHYDAAGDLRSYVPLMNVRQSFPAKRFSIRKWRRRGPSNRYS